MAIQQKSTLGLAGLCFGIVLMTSTTAHGDTHYTSSISLSSDTAQPSANHPPVPDSEPISVPVKALVERWAFGVTQADYEGRRFRYDIDSLGLAQGMALRMHFKF